MPQTTPKEIPGNVEEALEELPSPAYALDRNGIIVWENQAAIDLIGDRLGKHYSEVPVPEDLPLVREQVAKKILGESSTEYVSRIRDKGGKVHEVEFSSVPLKSGRRVVGVFGVGHLVDSSTARLPAAHVDLTPRQNQVLALLAQGRSTRDIAAELHLSYDTVRGHMRDALKRLGVSSRIGALLHIYDQKEKDG